MALKTLAFVTAYQYYALTHAKTPRERTKFLNTFQKVLEERIPEDIRVTLKKVEFRLDERLRIELSGHEKDELKLVANLFKQMTGEVIDANNIPKNRPIVGQLTSTGKVGFGLFVDVGIEAPAKEVLIPLFRLRRQLAGDNKLSVNQIVELYGLIDHLPVEIEVTKITYEKKGKPKVEGAFSERFLDYLRAIVSDGFEILFTTGETRQTIKKTIAKRGHSIDVIQIDRLGPLETAVVCKPTTTAGGLMAHIGQFVPNCRMSVFKPARIARYWDEA